MAYRFDQKFLRQLTHRLAFDRDGLVVDGRCRRDLVVVGVGCVGGLQFAVDGDLPDLDSPAIQ